MFFGLIASSGLLLQLTPAALANEDGIVGYATEGCSECHTGDGPAEGVHVAFVVEGQEVEARTMSGGETVTLGLHVQSDDESHVSAGLNVGATDGTLAGEATLLWREYELSHQFPHAMTEGARSFELSWTAPAYAGEFELSGIGNAVDHDGSHEGDAWNRASLLLTVESDCLDQDGDQLGDCEGDCDDTDASVQECDSGGDDGEADDTAADDTGADSAEPHDSAEESDSGRGAEGDETTGGDPDRGCGKVALVLPLGFLALLSGWRRQQPPLALRPSGEES